MLVAEVEPRSRTHIGRSASHARESSPSPLERRVSFWAACGVAVSAPLDEPRKSFMKFCVTDAIRPYTPPGPRRRYPNPSIDISSNTLTHGAGSWELLSCGFLRFALNVDFAFEVGAFFNRNPLRGNVAGNHGGLAQFDAVAGHYVALQLALHHHHFGVYRGLY